MRILDLYCGEGGAAKGYSDAGWEVVGVDVLPQPRYRFPFIQASALDLDQRFLGFFDAIHASPPCQALTRLNSKRERHVNLIPPTRAMLIASGKPYVIENVVGARAHMRDPVSLTGTMFGNFLRTSKGQSFVLSRERLFEVNWPLVAPEDSGPRGLPIANVFGGHLRARSGEYRTGNGTGRTVDFPGEDRPALARDLFDMQWASMKGISESVPPSYTTFIGLQLSRYLRGVQRGA